jgi:hypothetical protein
VDEPTCDSGLGFHVASLEVGGLQPGKRVVFTWQWRDTGAWHNQNYEVAVLLPEDA